MYSLFFMVVGQLRLMKIVTSASHYRHIIDIFRVPRLSLISVGHSWVNKWVLILVERRVFSMYPEKDYYASESRDCGRCHAHTVFALQQASVTAEVSLYSNASLNLRFLAFHTIGNMVWFWLTRCQTVSTYKYKNSSGDKIVNVNFYAVRPEATRIRWNNAKERHYAVTCHSRSPILVPIESSCTIFY